MSNTAIAHTLRFTCPCGAGVISEVEAEHAGVPSPADVWCPDCATGFTIGTAVVTNGKLTPPEEAEEVTPAAADVVALRDDYVGGD